MIRINDWTYPARVLISFILFLIGLTSTHILAEVRQGIVHVGVITYLILSQKRFCAPMDISLSRVGESLELRV